MPISGRCVAVLLVAASTSWWPRPATAAVTPAQVERAIANGVAYLKRQQLEDGSWPAPRTANGQVDPGLSAIITLALLTAGEPGNSPTSARALGWLERAEFNKRTKTYALSLQTMAFAAASPRRYLDRIAANAAWLEQTQIVPDRRMGLAAGSWGYHEGASSGDNSNTQYALLGLNAAAEAGVPIAPRTWALARVYWEQCQSPDGGWSYKPSRGGGSTATMSCAGVSSLLISGSRAFQSAEVLEGDRVRGCGLARTDPMLERGLARIGESFWVGKEMPWKYYYLYGLERAGRLSGRRYFGSHDWYREGAEELLKLQDPLLGSWTGRGGESDPLLATSFAILFLAKGRSPVLINKLVHSPRYDWNNDPDDVRNLVAHVATDWNHPLTWQAVDLERARTEELLQAPILFLNGHSRPLLTGREKRNLRDAIDQGAFLFAEACCGSAEFDEGFRALIAAIFPDSPSGLRRLVPEHPVWRIRHPLSPADHPLWGLELGCRTVVIYSPGDLSCYWNHLADQPAHPGVILATQLGQNVVDYATGRELPPDKLTDREVRNIARETPRSGALRIAKLRHGGDWDVAPMAVPNLMSALRRPPINLDVVLEPYALKPEDPNLANYPLVYVHGRNAMSFSAEQLANLRHHLDPGGGTLFADAACGSPAFDAAFRSFVKQLLPGQSLVSIPPGDAIYTQRVGYDLTDCRTTRAAGGLRGIPQLEGIKIDGHWAVIYSKLDIGCALERHAGPDCRGYEQESALRIAANIVLYATLP